MVMVECAKHELAFDLIDRMTDEMRNDFEHSNFTKICGLLRWQVLGHFCNR